MWENVNEYESELRAAEWSDSRSSFIPTAAAVEAQ